MLTHFFCFRVAPNDQSIVLFEQSGGIQLTRTEKGRFTVQMPEIHVPYQVSVSDEDKFLVHRAVNRSATSFELELNGISATEAYDVNGSARAMALFIPFDPTLSCVVKIDQLLES